MSDQKIHHCCSLGSKLSHSVKGERLALWSPEVEGAGFNLYQIGPRQGDVLHQPVLGRMQTEKVA